MPEETPSVIKLRELAEKCDAMESYSGELEDKFHNGRLPMAEREAAREEHGNLELELESLKAEMEKLEALAAIEQAVSQVKSFLPVAKYAVDSFKGEVAEILTNLVGALIDVREGLDDQLARLSQISAHSRFRQFEHYKTEGFTKEQAFMLVLAQIKPVNFEAVNKGVTSGLEAAARKR